MSPLTRAGLAVVVAFAAASTVAAPVTAQASACQASEGDSSRITGTLTSPAVDHVEPERFTVRVAGNFRDSRLIGDVDRIEATVLACDGQHLPAGSTTAQSYEGLDQDEGRSFVWDAPQFPKLAWNGPYAIELVVRSRDSSRTLVRPFRMDRPATPPSDVKASSAPDGTVTVTWEAPPTDTDPDVLGYVVEWGPASGEPSGSADVLPDGDEAAPTTFSHRPGPGEWAYRVTAMRPGGGDDVNASTAAAASAPAVVAPPTTTTGRADDGARASNDNAGAGDGDTDSSTRDGAGTGGASTPGSSGSTAAAPTAGGARAGTVDLSSFSRLLEQRRTTTAAPRRRAAEPDPGYQETLPFKPGDEPAITTQGDETGGVARESQELAQEVISDDSERRNAMGFVAASLLFGVLAYGLRLVKREAERVDLEATEPAGPAAPTELAQTPQPSQPQPEPGPGPAPGSVEATAALFADDSGASDQRAPEADFADDSERAPEADFADDIVLVGVAPAATTMPAPRPRVASNAPHLDVPLPPRRPRRPAPDGVGTGHAGRAARRVPPGSRADRGAGGEVVRARRGGRGRSDRRAPVR